MSVISQDIFWDKMQELLPHPVARAKLDALLTAYGEEAYRDRVFSALCHASIKGEEKIIRVVELMEEGARLAPAERLPFFTKRIMRTELGLHNGSPGKGN